MTTGQENQLKGFDLIHKGKVRDIYRYKSNEILIITSDRISAFDFIFNDEIDGKGKILTSLTKYWFRQTKDIIKNHLIDEIPNLENQLLENNIKVLVATSALGMGFDKPDPSFV